MCQRCFEGRIWDLIVSVSDHCLSFYLVHVYKVKGGQLGVKGLDKLDSYCSDKLIFMLSNRIVVSNKTFMQLERLNRLRENLHEID